VLSDGVSVLGLGVTVLGVGVTVDGVGDFGKVGQPESPLHLPSSQVLLPLHWLSDSQDLSFLSSKHDKFGEVGELTVDGGVDGILGIVGHPDSPLHLPSTQVL